MMNRPAQSLASRAFRWLRAEAGRCALVAAPIVAVAWPSTASAQGWLADRRYTEGAGIRTGDLELHPGIGAEVGYDSNWFLRSHEEGADLANGPPNFPVRDAALFRVTPSFYLSTLGAQRSDGSIGPRVISFRGGASATGRFFIGREMSKQHNVGANADARLDVNAGRPLGFGVFASYARLIQPQVLSDPDLSFNRSDIRAGAEVVAIPGGGTLDLRGGYQILGQLFEESRGVPYSSITHEITAKNRWRFRPRTALFSDTSLRFVNYPNAERAANYLNDSTPLRTRFGITGLVTDRFGLLLAAGYGATFFKAPEAATTRQYDSVNGQAEATLYLGKGGTDEPGKASLLLSTVSLGFLRDFQNSLLGNFYNTNKVYGRLEYWFGGKMLLRFDAYGEQLNYPAIFFQTATGPVQANGRGGVPINDFSNYRVGGGAFAEYRFTQSFGLNTTIDYVQQLSDTTVESGLIAGTNTPLFYDLNYRRFQAFLGARYFF